MITYANENTSDTTEKKSKEESRNRSKAGLKGNYNFFNLPHERLSDGHISNVLNVSNLERKHGNRLISLEHSTSNKDLTSKFNTPNMNTKKEKMLEAVDLEMRRTYKMKPPLISSKFPAAFEIMKRPDANSNKR